MAITRYSVDDYEEMVRLGALTKRDRVVLIRGEIVPKMPIGPKHAVSVNKTTRVMMFRVGERAVVGIGNPVRLADSEPEPDLYLARPPIEHYTSGHPEPPDILLIVEVSDSTLADDRNIMKAIYAEAGIAEYWIVNLVDECLEVHRGPRPDGTYQDERVLRRGQNTDIAAMPGVVVAVDELF